MGHPIYKYIELTGSSPTSIEDAVQGALAKAADSVRNMQWFEIVEVRGSIKDGNAVDFWQVTLKVGFKVED